MFNYVRLSDGGIERLDNVRPETVILCDIAEILVPHSGIDFSAFKQHRQVREAIAKIVPGMEQLADIDVAKREFHIGNRVLHEPKFGTPDNKAHFVVTPLPVASDAPIVLASVRSEGQFNTIIYEERDTYRAGARRDAVFLNRDDMAAFGVAAGQRITVRSAQGRMLATATPFDLPRGSALAYFPEANVLTATAVDPRSKTPAFKSVPVWIDP
jgi:anaerobic selenocysteine-containing dehydrogenase